MHYKYGIFIDSLLELETPIFIKRYDICLDTLGTRG
jgi:hypothetical protein